MQKSYLFLMKIGMPQANAFKSIGYTDTINRISISIKVYWNWPPTYLIFSAKISGLPISGDCTFTALLIVGKSTVSVYPTFYMHLKADFLFSQEKGKFFALTALDLLSWITQWQHNIKVLKILGVDLETCSSYFMYIQWKILKSRETITLREMVKKQCF